MAGRHLHAPARAPRPLAGLARPSRPGRRRRVVGLVVALTVVGGGTTHVVAEHVAAAQRTAAQQAARSAAVAAVRAEDRLQVRIADAAAARLTRAALGYAAVRRTQALDAARAAVQSADAVVVDATVDLPADEVTPLGRAAADLAALIDATPTVGAVTTPFHPEVLLDPEATHRASSPLRPAPAAPHSQQSGPTRAPVGGSAPVPDATAVAAGVTPVSAPVAGGVPRDATPDDALPAAPHPPSAGDVVVVPDAAADAVASAALPSDVVPVPAPATTADGEVQLAALDLAVSADVVAAADRVVELAGQVQAAADAAATEAAARAAAREAVERAAREAAAQLARAVAAADAAPNGQIPVELLCGVRFTDDVLLRCDAAQALQELAAAYRADHGRDLVVSSSYRTFDAQVALKAVKGGLAATPGRSNHGRGLAVDLAGLGGLGQFDVPHYLWMKAHAEGFGWHHPAAMEPGGAGPLEPWHWEYDTEDR